MPEQVVRPLLPMQTVEGSGFHGYKYQNVELRLSANRTIIPEFSVADTGNAYRGGAVLADVRASIAGLSTPTLMPSRADTCSIDTRLLVRRRRTSFSKSGRRC